jgi:hemerythrin
MRSSKKYVDVPNLEEYKNLPIEKKTTSKWFWPDYWYVAPFALPIKSRFVDSKNDSGTWEDFYDLMKKEYPIQYWLRETFFDNLESYFCARYRIVKDFYCKWVYYTFKPRNSRISSAIPKREYKETDQMIVDVLFAVVVSYIDDEKCFEHIDFSSTQEHRDFAKKLREIHKYIKTVRPEMIKKLDIILTDAYENREILSYKKRYGKYDTFLKKISEKDTAYCNWIVANRNKIYV